MSPVTLCSVLCFYRSAASEQHHDACDGAAEQTLLHTNKSKPAYLCARVPNDSYLKTDEFNSG